ncbi:MAG: ATP-binding protein [Bacteroidota bacterium]
MKKYPDKLAIQSDKKELKQVERFLRQLFAEEHLPEQAFNKVLLCVSEAVVNSIEHGNKNEKYKTVTLEVYCNDKDISIVVADEGDGFDYRKVADPTSKENIIKENGRGIFIMKSLCNELKFKQKGKCVELKIELV